MPRHATRRVVSGGLSALSGYVDSFGVSNTSRWCGAHKYVRKHKVHIRINVNIKVFLKIPDIAVFQHRSDIWYVFVDVASVAGKISTVCALLLGLNGNYISGQSGFPQTKSSTNPRSPLFGLAGGGGCVHAATDRRTHHQACIQRQPSTQHSDGGRARGGWERFSRRRGDETRVDLIAANRSESVC